MTGGVARVARPGPGVLLLLVATSAACGGADPAPPKNTVSDSAGITVVSSTSGTWQEEEAWRLAEEPMVSVGGRSEPGHDLFRVTGALRQGDGRLVVADGGSGEIRFFDAGGRYRYSAGGRGDGPGEFRSLSLLAGLEGDSLLAWDGRVRRLTVMDRNGAFVRTFSLSNSRFQVRSVLEDGTLLASDVRRSWPPVGQELPLDAAVRQQREYALFSPDGSLVRSLGTLPDHEIWSSFDVDHPHGQELLFGMRTVLAAGAGRIWVGTGESFELRGYDRNGTPSRIVRTLAFAHEPVTEALVAGRIAELQARWGEEEEHMLPVYRAQEAPEVVAPYDGLVVDSEGDLWVRRFRRPSHARDAWVVFDPTGKLLGTVTMPAGLELLDVGPDFIVARSTDAWDVERVGVYALDRSPVSGRPGERPGR